MNEQQELSSTLHNIKKIMERSSRFISLSGLSGISAGVCALCGAFFAWRVINDNSYTVDTYDYISRSNDVIFFQITDYLQKPLFLIALLTFVCAFVSAFFFTYLRSKKTGIPIWGKTAVRLMINVIVPMVAGGIFLLRLITEGIYSYIAPGCLLFYGLALLNASKYTLVEIRYLAYGQIILALINLWFMHYGLFFWAIGFGVLHILYGAIMWWKYERTGNETAIA